MKALQVIVLSLGLFALLLKVAVAGQCGSYAAIDPNTSAEMFLQFRPGLDEQPIIPPPPDDDPNVFFSHWNQWIGLSYCTETSGGTGIPLRSVDCVSADGNVERQFSRLTVNVGGETVIVFGGYTYHQACFQTLPQSAPFTVRCSLENPLGTTTEVTLSGAMSFPRGRYSQFPSGNTRAVDFRPIGNSVLVTEQGTSELIFALHGRSMSGWHATPDGDDIPAACNLVR
jgi:hypothetical protein